MLEIKQSSIGMKKGLHLMGDEKINYNDDTSTRIQIDYISFHNYTGFEMQ